MAAGRQEGFDLTRSGLAFAGGALGGALGQAAYDKTCFAADTPLIARHEQGWRRADEIRVDDYLASRDEHDPLAPVVWNRVEEVFVAQGEIWELEWQGRTIRTTAEHPFYVYQLGWTPARELKPGMLLATMDGRYLPLTALASTGKVETVYNFRIAEGHTYFVGKPDWDAALWAHNACDSRALGQSLIDAGKKGRKGLQAAHVVPTGDFSNRSLEVRSAIKKARSAIEFAGIEINSASNGFWARAGHKGTHRDKYFLELGSILSKARASGKQEIITALEKIRQNAEAGVYRGKNYKR